MKEAIRLISQLVVGLLLVFAIFPSPSVCAQTASDTPTAGANSPPEVRLVLPETSAIFSAPATIRLIAQGSDRDGYVRTVEFFANDRSLGTTTNNPLSASALNPFQLTWQYVAAGEYVLRAKATDNKGASTISAGVKVTVMSIPPQVEVNVVTIKGEAVEEGDSRSRTLIFRFARSGSRDFDLPVFYSAKGSAMVGQDFPKLSGNITIPKGAESVELNFEVINDDLPEAVETVIVQVEPPACIAIFPPPPECYLVGARSEARAAIAASDNPQVPVVGIVASLPETSEPSPEVRVQPGRFTITVRGGSGSFPVFFEIGGTARNGEDYQKIVKWVMAPSDTNVVNVDIAAIDDTLFEADESIELKLTTQQSDDFPFLMPIRLYSIDSEHSSARVVIHDNDQGPALATIEMTAPKEGQSFVNPAVVAIAATAVDPNGYISRVEFYVGEQKIGVSEITFVRAPDPGTPIQHAFEWRNPPPGAHVLTARASDSLGNRVISPPIHIAIAGSFDLPAVGVRLVPDPREIPWPNADFAPGWFEFSRTGSTNTSLAVFFEVSGTATAGVDYASLPRLAFIPAGASRITLSVEAKDDFLIEGDETVIVGLIAPPLAADLNAAVIYRIDPDHSRATLIILDNDRPAGDRVVVSVEATDAKATEPASSIGEVDTATFTVRRLAGPREVAVTVFYALDGTARHGIDYKGLSGEAVLRAGEESAVITLVPIADKALEGEEIVTLKIKEPVCPAIFPPPADCYQIASPGSARAVIIDSSTGQAPTIAITRPLSGSEFSANTAIEIVAEAHDADGYVPKTEFFAASRKIGEQNIAFVRPPMAGETQAFRFVWREPMPGPHVLTVRATDNHGSVGESRSVAIKVSEPDTRPIVTVAARDAFAVEHDFKSELNTATFVIRRTGSTNDALTVNYTLRGTAENGIDYEKLTGIATIPAGSRTTTVVVRPFPDNFAEGIETVILQLNPSAAGVPQSASYRLGSSPRAVAVIADALLTRATVETKVEAQCTAIADGFMHLRFSGETGVNFRVEMSSDFLNWETISNAIAFDGTVNHVDDSSTSRQKFYRVTPEPVALSEE